MPEKNTGQPPVPIDRVRGGESSEQIDLFRLLVQSVREYAIFELDPLGNVLTWNPGAQAMKGYTREEIVGKHFSQFYPAEAVQSVGRNENWSWRKRKVDSSMKAGG